MASVVSPKDSAELIAKLSTHVKLNVNGIHSLAEKLATELPACQQVKWNAHELNPRIADESAVNWIFLVDSLNFSFWTDDDRSAKYSVTCKSKSYTGYWALCAAVNRAIDEGYPVTSADFYANVTESTASHIFRADNADVQIPLLKQRVQVMQESGNNLIQHFNGSFVNCIKQAGHSAQKLLHLIVQNFPSYRDVSNYKGHEVSFLKRAQILVADIWACYEGKGLGQFDDIDTLTMFADYRVPQVLVYFNALEYSDELKQVLGEKRLMTNGDEMECEIRGLSIVAVERIRSHVGCLLKERNSKIAINSSLIDFYLWEYRRDNSEPIDKAVPFHRVRSIFY
ncbi:hypothetical protein HDE_11950 [Halotydeus destructor]|nr:hypothetical protein HDE_11950 [Halotydeus destructor]